MSDELTGWLRAQCDEDERVARMLLAEAQNVELTLKEPKNLGKYMPGWTLWPDVQRMAWDRLAQVAATRRIIAEHEPTLDTVEWPHDQDGKGNAFVCRRCQNAEHTAWNPPIGEAGILPEGFVTSYVLAPCRTLRLLALPFAVRDGYKPEWSPDA